MKIDFSYMLAVTIFAFSPTVFAALTLDSTRYIYNSDDQAVSVTVSNGVEKEFGAQVWVDNIIEKDSSPTFIATPSFFKIQGNGKQVFRIMKVSESIPNDKESIYWLNVQEIPPKQKGSGIAMAIRTQVKLIHRPSHLAEGRRNAEEDLTIENLPGESWLVNTTPYVFAIGGIYDDANEVIQLSNEAKEKLVMFKPGDRVKVNSHTVKAVSALNDYGNVVTYELSKK